MNKLVIALLILTTVVINRTWFFDFSTLTSGDWYSHFTESLVEDFSLPNIWTTDSLGGFNIGLSFYPFNLISGWLASNNFSYGLIERLVFMFPLLIVGIIGIYLLLHDTLKDYLGAAVGSLVYMFNTYFMIGRSGHLTLMSSFAFAPLTLYFFHRSFEKRKLIYVLLAGLSGYVASFYEFRGFYLLAGVVLAYLVYSLFVTKLTRREVLVFCLYTLLFFGIIILLNSYWLFAFGSSGSLSSNQVFGRSLFGSSFLNILNGLTLFHPFWTGGVPAVFIVEPITSYFWLIPVMGLLGFVLHKRDHKILFYGFITLLGIFLTKQEGVPFQGIYSWLYLHIPGFNAFREASKFFFLVALGYSVLIGSFFRWLWNHWSNNSSQRLGKYLLTTLVIGMFLWNTKPVFTGTMGTLFKPRHTPSDYLIVKDFLLKDRNTYYRTLWAPTDSRWSFYLNNHPKISLINMINSQWSGLIKPGAITAKYTETDKMLDFLGNSFTDNLLDMSSVKYVFIPLQDTDNDDNFYIYYGRSRENYLSGLAKLSYLKPVSMDTRGIKVFENPDFKPHLYLTLQPESLAKHISFRTVSYQFINPSQYSLSLDTLSSPVYLNFSESFDTQWKLRTGRFNWFEALTKKNYFLPDKYHFKNAAGLNTFILNPSDPDIANLSNQSITLYYLPQSYVYMGLVIGVGTFIGLGFSFSILFLRSRKLR